MGYVVMYESQGKGLRFDPFQQNEAVLEEIVQLGVELVGEKHR